MGRTCKTACKTSDFSQLRSFEHAISSGLSFLHRRRLRRERAGRAGGRDVAALLAAPQEPGRSARQVERPGPRAEVQGGRAAVASINKVFGRLTFEEVEQESEV